MRHKLAVGLSLLALLVIGIGAVGLTRSLQDRDGSGAPAASASSGEQAQQPSQPASSTESSPVAPPGDPTLPASQDPAPPASATGKAFYGSAFDGSSQVIVVTASRLNTTRAILTAYQKSGENWTSVLSVDAVVGKYGLVYDKDRIEGGMQTPIGLYSLLYAFGVSPNPSTNQGTSLPYRVIGDNTYYDGQYDSPTFNTLVEGKPANNEYEYMYKVTAYRYGIDLGFNLEQVPGKGNAIFLHCNSGSGYTAGCVSVSSANMVWLLQWLDRNQEPKILICLDSELQGFYH